MVGLWSHRPEIPCGGLVTAPPSITVIMKYFVEESGVSYQFPIDVSSRSQEYHLFQSSLQKMGASVECVATTGANPGLEKMKMGVPLELA